jgi:hypothetical protein
MEWKFFRKNPALVPKPSSFITKEENTAKVMKLIETFDIGDLVSAKLFQGRKIAESQGARVHKVIVRKREWVYDENGPMTGPIDGKRGYYKDWKVAAKVDNLLTNGGRDFFIEGDYTNSASGNAPANNIAYTMDNGTPSASDTALASEITNSDLARSQAGTRTHTNGTNAWSLVQTVTAANVYTTNGGVQKSGLFNVATAPVSGVLCHEASYTAVPLQINDQLQLTWSGTLG